MNDPPSPIAEPRRRYLDRGDGELQLRVARGVLGLIWLVGMVGIFSSLFPDGPRTTVYRVLFLVIWLGMGTYVGCKFREDGLALRAQSLENSSSGGYGRAGVDDEQWP